MSSLSWKEFGELNSGSQLAKFFKDRENFLEVFEH